MNAELADIIICGRPTKFNVIDRERANKNKLTICMGNCPGIAGEISSQLTSRNDTVRSAVAKPLASAPRARWRVGGFAAVIDATR